MGLYPSLMNSEVLSLSTLSPLKKEVGVVVRRGMREDCEKTVKRGDTW